VGVQSPTDQRAGVQVDRGGQVRPAIPRLGGDCLADIGLLRAEPAMFGRVASDPSVSRLIDALTATPPRERRSTAPEQSPRPGCRSLPGTTPSITRSAQSIRW